MRKKADLLDLRFHDLRHATATRTAENGASIIAVKEICGHSDIKTTMRYAHPDKSLKEELEFHFLVDHWTSNYSSGLSVYFSI